MTAPRRVWRPDANRCVYAVITHDDGQIYTVKPNTEQTARDEAWMADGTPILIRFLDDPNPRIVADYPALSVTTQESE